MHYSLKQFNCRPVLVLVLLLLAFRPGAQAQTASASSEAVVNATTNLDQRNPEVAMAPDGSYIVVWEGYGSDGSDYGIYFQRFNSNFTANGSETLVNNTTEYGQRHPDVAISGNGSFVITWDSYLEDGDGHGVWFALYDNTGSLVQRNRVNDSLADEQIHPCVAMDYDGNFVVGYMDDGQDGDSWSISYQGFNSSGIAQFAETVVNSTTTGFQGHPDVAMDSAGNYTFVWQDNGSDGDGAGIFMQRYDNTNSTVGSETQINTTNAENQINPAVSIDNDGNMMIVWSSYNQDGDHYGIYGRIYNSSGVAQTGEIAVNSTTAGTQDYADVTRASGGTFAVTWTSYDQDGDAAGVYLQDFLADGSTLGSEQQVNTTTSLYQQTPGIAGIDDHENLAIVWQSGDIGSTSSQDGSGYAVINRMFSVADVTDPDAVCQNITVYLDATGNITVLAAEVDGGSTDNVGVTGLAINTSSFTCANIGNNNVTLTVTDAAGNSGACVAVITVEDSTSPTAVCQNIDVYLDGTGNATITAAQIDNGSSDNCSTVSLSASQTSFTCSDVGANSVTLTVTDGSSNTSTCVATVTVIDSVSPTAVCQNLTTYLDASGNATITAGDLDGGSTDNCGGSLSYSVSQSSFTCANIGANTVTLTVTDAGGNSASCSATVTVLDSISPTATCQDITAYLDATGNVSINAADLDGGSSDNCGSVTTSINTSSFTCANIGANTVTLTATDGSGNTSTCTATVTVADTVTPTVVCQNISVYVDGSGSATITSADIDGGSTDNCSAVTLSASQTSFNCSNVGSNNVTLTGTDAAGNSASCIAVVTVIDSVTPTAACQNITVYLDGTGNATITAADVDNGSSDNCGGVGTSIDVSSFDCTNIGANTVTLTVTDASSNSATCSSIVTVIDSVSPTASCQNITAYLDATGNVSITAADVDNGSSDNCGSVSTSIDVSSFTCANIGANTVTLTVSDGQGNTSTCVSTVTVADTISPTMTCQNVTVYLDAAGTANITTGDIDGGSTDNCGTVTLSASQTSFTCANAGSNLVTLTGTDAAGNASTCSAVVTVIDSVAPTAVCQNITVYLDAAGNASITAADVDGGSTDNCGTVTTSVDVTNFDCTNIGANTVTLTVTDGSSNTATCSATVTVADTVSPTATCQNITAYLDGTGNVTIAAADVDGGSTDNCGAVTTSINVSSFDCTNIGANTVTLTVTDGQGNTSNCAATVTIADTISPVIACQNVTVYLDAAGTANITTGDIDGGSTDNCSAVTLSSSQSAFTCANIGANNVTLTGTDASGNTGSCVAVVTVIDSVAPTAACQNVTVYLDASGNATITAADVDGGSTDNCGTVTTSVDVTSFDCTNLGANTVTLTVTDGSSNTATCTATVTVADTISPTASCQNITAYLDAAGNATITAGDVDGGSTDNCGAVTTSIDVSNFDCTNIGANTVTLTVTDGEGNSSNCTAIVTIADTTAPVVACQNVTVYLDAAGTATISTGDVDAGTTDNCSTPSLSLDVTSFTCANVGANTVTLTATDAESNSASCAATVTVIDSTAPTAVCQNITVYLDANGDATITAADIDGGSADNCGTVTLSADVTTFDCASVGSNTVTLTVTDASNNTATCTATVDVIDSIAPVVTNCPADINITANAAGCMAVVTWTDPTVTDACVVTTTQTHSSGDMFPLGVTTVTYTYTDASGNVDSCVFDVVVTNDLTVSIAGTDVLCNGDSTGTGVTTVTGGTMPYSYAWSTGETGQDELSLSAGMHYLTVTDANGCTVMDSVSIGEPASLMVMSTTTDVLCNGDSTGTATLTITGGVGPYVEDWGSANPAQLAAGTHTYVVTDVNGCTYTDSVTINEPTAITATTDSILAGCGLNDGMAWVTASGGTPGYTYQWDAAAGNQTTDTAFNLAAGSYVVTITDANGCTFDAVATVTNPGGPVVTANATFLNCANDSNGVANAMAMGGVPPLNFSWDNGDVGPMADSLTAGIWVVTVVDAMGCIGSDTAVVNAPPALGATATVTNPTCNNDSDGIAIVNPFGGVPGYTIDWMGADETNLADGTYPYTITDANGCTYMDSVTVVEPSLVSASSVVTPVLCNGDSTGTAMITPAGGTPGYTIDWLGMDANALPAGVFTYIVTDTNGCTYTDSVHVTEPTALMATTDSIPANCGANDGSAWVVATGGTAGYTYLWDANAGNQTTDSAFNLLAGLYTVTVTDANGCSMDVQATVTNLNAPVIDIDVTDITCYGLTNGMLDASASTGAGTLTFSWSTGDSTAMIDSLGAGTYVLTLTDSASCIATQTVVLEEPDTLIVTDSVTNVLCNGDATGTATLTITGGRPGYTEDWSGADPNALTAGTYPYMVEDASGCVVNGSVIITEPTAISLSATATIESLGNDGAIDLTVSGGTPGYTYDWDNDGTGDFDDNEDLTGLTGPMSYLVTVMDANGCTDTLTVFVDSEVGIVDNTGDGSRVNIYPNPNEGQFYVAVNNFGAEVVNVEVFDAAGRLVRRSTMADNSKMMLSLDQVERGAYRIRVSAGDQFYTTTLILY